MPRLDSQRPQVPIREGSERGFSDANNCYWPHTKLRIALHVWAVTIVKKIVGDLSVMMRGVAADGRVGRNTHVQEAPETRFDAVQVSSDLQSRFVAENMRRVFLLIFRIVRNVDDAQDLTQEAFIKALQRQDQLKDLEKAAHWLSRIATNTAIDFLRRSGRAQFTEIDDAPAPALRSRLENPEQRVLRAEHRNHLEEALGVLTGRERLALLLRDVEDLSADEVAERLQCSKATVRSHIANGRVKLKKFFERNARKGIV